LRHVNVRRMAAMAGQVNGDQDRRDGSGHDGGER
jgi:hypothetical protein